jgi:hypothetical protein
MKTIISIYIVTDVMHRANIIELIHLLSLNFERPESEIWDVT